MFIRQLHYLIALDQYRHFGRAAESCHVSQPALSNGIRELERELGITIVRRNRSFEGITPEGERVIQWVRQTLLPRLQAAVLGDYAHRLARRYGLLSLPGVSGLFVV